MGKGLTRVKFMRNRLGYSKSNKSFSNEDYLSMDEAVFMRESPIADAMMYLVEILDAMDVISNKYGRNYYLNNFADETKQLAFTKKFIPV